MNVCAAFGDRRVLQVLVFMSVLRLSNKMSECIAWECEAPQTGAQTKRIGMTHDATAFTHAPSGCIVEQTYVLKEAWQMSSFGRRLQEISRGYRLSQGKDDEARSRACLREPPRSKHGQTSRFVLKVRSRRPAAAAATCASCAETHSGVAPVAPDNPATNSIIVIFMEP